MSLCVAMLIAAEFMPVSLLTPIAQGLGASAGQTGQAIAISGFFAVAASLVITLGAGRLNRKWLLVAMTGLMLISLILVAMAPSFAVLMLGRAVLGITIGGFWSMATAVLMRLVEPDRMPRALTFMYAGQASAAAFAAPIGSYLGAIVGWRGVFWLLVPIVAINLVWQIIALPSLPVYKLQNAGTLIGLLRRGYFVRGLVAALFTFAGAYAMFTYLRPFLETVTSLGVHGVTLMLLILGCAGFPGSWVGGRIASRHAIALVIAVPLMMLLATIGLVLLGQLAPLVGLFLALWGMMNTALSIGWMAWIAQNVSDAPEAAGSLIVASIQATILCGAALGGWLLDRFGIHATFIGSAAILVLALLTIGSGRGLRRAG